MDLKSLIPTYTKQKNGQYDYTFTVFTPVYNRADTIKRVFDSLNAQTYRDFELLIINDGSTDNSHDVIEDLIKSCDFPVRYVNNKENKHKMACLLQGVQLANGKFFLTFDSDDECTENALEAFKNTYDAIPDNQKESVCSLTCLCQDQFGNLVGEKFDTDLFYSSTFGNMLMDRFKSEKWGFTKTDVLKGISVNEFLFAKGYIPEGVIWNLFSKENYKTLYFNEILRIYYIDTENNISSGQIKNNALGLAIYSLANANWFYKNYFYKNPILFFKQVYLLLLSSKYLDFNRRDYSKALNSNLLKSLFNICWPFRVFITAKPIS
ncbi:glycosyltransferase family 2 protein [Hanstruepera neustonica]|uniref:Glycosyltransferase family 2 protein n=1 Tax=Hanstruepera neustonica TaxID=1445657 RepID=A0A2K1DYD7_9FLAO|nr:glycosyltransferase family 2 protein [Hanstruepera neustonica]PNQ73032.1 glycosyltransferase family 2 protein [Hanstruepera neustonica]